MESEAPYLANIGRVFGSSGSLEQAGGYRERVFLDQLPEAGGGMSRSRIRSLAFFPQCQIELLCGPTGKKGVTHDTAETYGVSWWRYNVIRELLFRSRFIYLDKRDIAAVLAMFTTLDMWGIFELVCTIPALPQPSPASSAACEKRKLIIKKNPNL